MVGNDLAGPDPLEQHYHSTIRVMHLREGALAIGHAHSLANHSDESGCGFAGRAGLRGQRFRTNFQH